MSSNGTHFLAGWFRWTTLFLSLPFAFFSSCGKENRDASITIAAASNMQYALSEISKRYIEKSGVKTNLVISSSGKITAQILEGAPIDIFISADIKYPETIISEGVSLATPKVFAKGKLVLWTTNSEVNPSIEILTSDQIKHIAIANPETAPYGLAATEVLNFYSLLDKVESKLVFGESISQTNQYILSQSAEIGFTSKSVVLSPAMRNKGSWKELDSLSYNPIQQSVLIIQKEEEIKYGVKEFKEFLFSDEVKKILVEFGYSVNE